MLKSPSTVRYWDPLLSKLKKKLAAWKGRTVSMAGRLVLLKATIDSLPTYWMSLHRLPKIVINNIDIVRRRFLWSCTNVYGEMANKMHTVAWRKVCSSKEEGGLGLK